MGILDMPAITDAQERKPSTNRPNNTVRAPWRGKKSTPRGIRHPPRRGKGGELPPRGRPPTVTPPRPQVGAQDGAGRSENHHEPDVQVAGSRVCGNCQQGRFARERDAGALDQNAQAGGRIADRVSEGADVDLQRGPYTGRFMAEYDAEVSDDPLYMLRHSTAHVLAAAVTQLFPGTKYARGPPV